MSSALHPRQQPIAKTYYPAFTPYEERQQTYQKQQQSHTQTQTKDLSDNNNMGEIKSVKVDNWGVFFLQKLQNFFNKTDYCDLTLQFRDNSQLKVHRLVLSACTDYFNSLEQTCEIIDDALIMPNEFQADVVVPIVNFMYTGTLEFELKMYGRLLRTAKEMNMTVLLKLLEAHRRTMENVNRQQRPPSPKSVRKSRAGAPTQTISPQRSAAVIKQTQGGTQQATQIRKQGAQQRSTGAGSTSLLRSSIPAANIKAQYGNTIVYEPIKTEVFEENTSPVRQQQQQQQSTSPFEQLRKGYNNNKRPANPTTFLSPPTKKPNLEDVKEFAEQQRMRKQIAAEFGDDQEYDGGMLDDDVHNDDDDDEMLPQPSTSKQQQSTQQQQQQQQQQGYQYAQVEHGSSTITFKQEAGDKPPTIIVKDSSNTKLNHAKIISEVLRQHPYLVKGNRNIKLKIMPNSGSGGGGAGGTAVGTAANANTGAQIQKIVVKNEPDVSNTTTSPPKKMPQLIAKTIEKPAAAVPPANSTTVQKTAPATAAPNSTAAAAITQKRRIDSKTMHALIALGAENTTGPWLCLRCGVNGRPISIPSYRGFRRHLINTHKESIDPALCDHCGWRSPNNRELHFHLQLEHKIKSMLFTFAECAHCPEIFLNMAQLNQHAYEVHPDVNKQQCIYCNKIFAKELQLYNHMKTYHKEHALEDGIIDDTDEEFPGSMDDDDDESSLNEAHKSPESKVQILSDISLPSAKIDSSTENALTAAGVDVSNISEIIQTSTTDGGEVKFISADGSEVHLTEEQRKELLSQLNQDHDNISGDVDAAAAVGSNVVMLLNETPPAAADADVVGVKSETADIIMEPKSAETEESLGDDELNEDGDIDASSMPEDYDDSQIYSELNAQQQDAPSKSKKNDSGNLDESKESIDNLEWAENLLTEHDMEEETGAAGNKKQQEQKRDDISQKLKELTGDWSEDENDEMEEEELDTTTKSNEDKIVKDTKHRKESVADNATITEKRVASVEENIENMHEDVETVHASDEVEDDIDLALQSLHKDDEPIAAATSERTAAASAAETTTSKQTIAAAVELKPVEKMEVDESGKTTHDSELELKLKCEIEEEFIEETPPVEQKVEATAAADDEHVDAHLETENIRKTLLDELIAEADNAKDNNDHLLVDTDEEDTDDVEEEVTDDKLTSEIVEKTADAAISIKTETVKPITPDASSSANVDDHAKATAGIIAADHLTIDDDSAIDTEKSSSTETSAAPVAATEDKVKSLISEWGDDEDDIVDEDEDRVKEEL